jgi:hypothetical protein
MKIHAAFDEQGFPIGFWHRDLFPDQEDGSLNPAIPGTAIPITTQQWRALVENSGLRRWQDGHVVPYTPPPPPEPINYRLYKSVFIERMTPEEAATLKAVLDAEEAKLQLMFQSVEYFLSDDPLFAVLHWTVTEALGSAGRADELLAPES